MQFLDVRLVDSVSKEVRCFSVANPAIINVSICLVCTRTFDSKT